MDGEMASATMPFLPQWLRLAWLIALGAVAVTHVGHAVVMPGRRRWWHLGHTAMAIGMALMYLLPRMEHPGLYSIGLVVFALATLAEAVTTVVLWRRDGILESLWLLATLDMLAMTYMLLPPTVRPTWLTVVVVLYLASQVAAWSLGGRLAGSRGRTTADVRVTLAVMAASMAYMLAVM